MVIYTVVFNLLMPSNTLSQSETLRLVRQEMETHEHRNGDQDSASRSSDDVSPMSHVSKKKKKKKDKEKEKDKDGKSSKDPDKKKKKKSKKRSEQSAGEPPEDTWNQPKGPSLLDDDEQSEVWGIMHGSVHPSTFVPAELSREQTHQFVADFSEPDFLVTQSLPMQATRRTQSLKQPTTDFDDFNPRQPSRSTSQPSDWKRYSTDDHSREEDDDANGFDDILPQSRFTDRPRPPPRRIEPDEQSFGGWVVDDTNKGENIGTYVSRRNSIECSNYSGSDSRENTEDTNKTRGASNFTFDDRSYPSRAPSAQQQPYNGGYDGDYNSQYDDDGGSGSRSGNSKGGDQYQGHAPRGLNATGKTRNIPKSNYDDAYYSGVAPNRLGASIGDDHFDDSGTISSEITGLTGAFSDFQSSFVDEDYENEPDVVPLAYPTFDRAESNKLARMQQLERKQRREKRGRSTVRFGGIEIRHYERILGDNPRYVFWLSCLRCNFLPFLILTPFAYFCQLYFWSININRLEVQRAKGSHCG